MKIKSYICEVSIFSLMAMIDLKKFSAIQTCLDEYMSHIGKNEINDMEANRELARAGLLDDSQPYPGKPLRNLLAGLRDFNLLPPNIRQKYGTWVIKLSTTIAKCPLVNQFQYC